MQKQVNSLDSLDSLKYEVRELKEIAKDTNSILLQQGEQLNLIQEDVITVTDSTSQAVKDLNTALNYKSNIIKPLTGGLIGLAITGPIGLSVGLTGLTLSTVCSVGALLGIIKGL